MKKQLSIVLCLLLLVSVLLTGCTKEVAVDASGLQNITFAGETVANDKDAYTATLTAGESYALPETLTVTVGGTALTEGYTWDPATGTLRIDPAYITGDIAISGTATESIVGAWTGTVDITDYVTDTMAATDASMASYFTFSDLAMDLTMTFTAEGTCSMEFDQESVEALVSKMLEQMRPGLEKLLEETLAAQGLDMSLEEFLEMSGMSLDDMMAEMTAELSFTEDMLEDLNQSGKYQVKDGCLWISEDLDSEIDEDDYQLYTIENGVLTIDLAEGDDDKEVAFLFPLTLTRVN